VNRQQNRFDPEYVKKMYVFSGMNSIEYIKFVVLSKLDRKPEHKHTFKPTRV